MVENKGIYDNGVLRMKRIAEEKLETWHRSDGRKPLVIRGARQVGKSTLVRMFAEKAELKLYEINLERHLELDEVFKSLDVHRIIRELEPILGAAVDASDGLLFLDEIQSTPHALAALRYFYEDMPQLRVIAAGSLLEFVLADHAFSMPVGRVEYLHLGPATFEEFLEEVEPYLLGPMRVASPDEPMADSAHERLLSRFREYLMVGGMPEAVVSFAKLQQFSDVALRQQTILATYQDDFSKYARQSDLLRLQRVFNYAPRAIGTKVKYSNISREDRSRELRNAIDLLVKAKVLSAVYHSDCSGLPLHADIDERAYKLLFLDVGLMVRACGLDWTAISNLDSQRLVNEGAIAEQFVGQHLLRLEEGRMGPHLCYWIREGKSTNAEVDFVISRCDAIVPIEVKAGASGSLRSLWQFALKKKSPFAVRFDLNPISCQEISHTIPLGNGFETLESRLISMPLYMVGQVDRIIEWARMSKG